MTTHEPPERQDELTPRQIGLRIAAVTLAVLMLIALMIGWVLWVKYQDGALMGSTKAGVIGPVKFS